MSTEQFEKPPTFEDLSQKYETQKINSELLPTLRCYHCNKLLSFMYPQLYVPDLNLENFFKAKNVSRYCCKLVLVQDYYSYYDVSKEVTKSPTNGEAL
jgi:DNA-directed RNA polymerase subunit N (RpoN/RPB10)